MLLGLFLVGYANYSLRNEYSEMGCPQAQTCVIKKTRRKIHRNPHLCISNVSLCRLCNRRVIAYWGVMG